MYGLLVAGVSFAIYPLGLEFYTFSTRDLINKDKNEWGNKLYTQLLFHLLLYLLFIPLYYLILKATSLSQVLWFFIALVVLEHLNQELFRLHVIVNDQIVGSLNIFIRQGLWVIFLVPLVYLYESLRTIEFLLVFWIAGELVALSLSLVWLVTRTQLRLQRSFDTGWLKSAFKTILPLFIATLCLRALSTLDRFIFESLANEVQLSAYVFYISLASLIFTINDSGVFSFRYPRLVKSFHSSLSEYSQEVKIMFTQVTLFSVIFSVLLLIFSSSISNWLDNKAIIEYSSIFYWLLLAKNIQVFGMIPHYCLYAKRLDGNIMFTNIFGFSVFVVMVAILRDKGATVAVPMSLCVAYTSILLSKIYRLYSQ